MHALHGYVFTKISCINDVHNTNEECNIYSEDHKSAADVEDASVVISKDDERIIHRQSL